MPEVKKFEVGQTYAERFMSDWDSIAYFKVLARTDKTVRVEVHGEKVSRRVAVYNGVEQFKPYGSYSMCMIVDASEESKELANSKGR